MYQANALSCNISAILTLLAEKLVGLSDPTTYFIYIEEAQHDSHLDVMIDNKLGFDEHINDMSKKATNLLYLCH